MHQRPGMQRRGLARGLRQARWHQPLDVFAQVAHGGGYRVQRCLQQVARLGAAEDQPKQRRVVGRKAHIGQAAGQKARLATTGGGRGAALGRCQPLQPRQCQRRHQRALVRKVPVNRGGADTHIARHLAQAQVIGIAGGQQLQARLDQRAAQITMVVGLAGLGQAFYVDAVIFDGHDVIAVNIIPASAKIIQPPAPRPRGPPGAIRCPA